LTRDSLKEGKYEMMSKGHALGSIIIFCRKPLLKRAQEEAGPSNWACPTTTPPLCNQSHNERKEGGN